MRKRNTHLAAVLVGLLFAGCLHPQEADDGKVQLVIDRVPVTEPPADEANYTVRLDRADFERFPPAVQQGFREADANRTAVIMLDAREHCEMYDHIEVLAQRQGLQRASYYWFDGGLYAFSRMTH